MSYNYFRNSAKFVPSQKDKKDWFGGEVTNQTKVDWLISAGGNRHEKDFVWLPSGENSDESELVDEKLGQSPDIDAVWPAGKTLKAQGMKIGKVDGAFKIKSHQNCVIELVENEFIIKNYWEYISEEQLKSFGWSLPDIFK